MPSPSASTFFRFVRDPKHDGGGKNRRLRGLRRIWGSATADRTARGETTKDTKGCTEEHEARRGTQSQRTQRTQRGRGRGPRRTGWTARGNRRLRGLGQIGGRLPPTGLPEGEITKRTKGGTRGHEGEREKAQRAAREARAVGSGQRAKPAERPVEPASLPRNLASLRLPREGLAADPWRLGGGVSVDQPRSLGDLAAEPGWIGG